MRFKLALAAVLVPGIILCARFRRAPRLPEGVALEKDMAYCEGGGRDLRMDIAYPKGPSSPRPGVLLIHGGAWRGGAKEMHTPQILEFARRGYVSAAIEYRLCPAHIFPAQIEDAKCAVRFLRANARKYGLDPSRLGAAGFSAGGHLSLLLGTMDEAAGLDGEGGRSGVSSRVQAVVSFAGPADLLAPDFPRPSQDLLKDFLGGTLAQKPRSYRDASPLSHLGPGDAAILAFQGSKDALVPFTQCIALDKAIKHHGLSGRCELLDGQGHGWAGRELERTLAEMFSFFDDRLKMLPPARPGHPQG